LAGLRVQTLGHSVPLGLHFCKVLKGLKMNRITRKDIDGAINYLNRITGNDAEPYRKEGDKWVANKGNFHLSGAYGGHSLHQMSNDDGGIRDIFNCGHVPMRELYDLIHAYIKGIEFARKEVTA
jgi:hypothetical protein